MAVLDAKVLETTAELRPRPETVHNGGVRTVGSSTKRKIAPNHRLHSKIDCAGRVEAKITQVLSALKAKGLKPSKMARSKPSRRSSRR